MTDYDSILSQMDSVAPSQVAGNIDEDPEKGAKALELSQQTGVPALALYNNYDGFKDQYKATLATGIVRNNPELGVYVRSHPLAPVISNDDYGNLDQFSQGASGTSRFLDVLKSPKTAFEAGVAGAGAGFKEGFSQSTIPDGVTPTLSSASVDLVGRMMNAVAGAVTGGLSSAGEAGYTAATGDPAGGRRFGRDLGAIGEQHLISGEGVHEATQVEGQMVRLNDAYKAGKQWYDAGVEPPSGLHPLIDQAKALDNATALNSLNEDLARAQESLTKDRSSPMFQRFAEQHFGDAEIGIAGDRVSALYGDAVPHPEDGLLGWVPGIEDKLALAKETGEDINIPIADWLTKVDPKVAADLNDDIRMWPGGITGREALVPVEPRPMVDAPIAAVRGQASLEPMFSIGDRKIQLQKAVTADEQARQFSGLNPDDWGRLSDEERADYTETAKREGGGWGPLQGLHDFSLVDQTGKTIGNLNLSEQRGGKQLYIEMVNGVNGLGPRDFGPSLMRDLLRQIKEQFPNAETLTGHRVSGARDVADSFNEPSAHPVIRLDNPKGWDIVDTHNEFSRMLEGGQWHAFSPTLNAYLKPFESQDIPSQRLINAVQEELGRIVPKGVDTGPAERISVENPQGYKGKIEPQGVFHSRRGANSVLMYALDSPNVLGTARHEAIHHLRQYGFFNDAEWGVLEKAAKDNAWADQFNISDRYPTANESIRLEESIADAYKTWAEGRGEAGPELTGIFQRMKDLFDRIVQHIGQILGKAPSWEDVFQKVESGEVGGREGTTPLFERASAETLSEEEARRLQDTVANDKDAFGKSVAPTYQGAVNDQIFRRYIDDNTTIKNYEGWRKIAEENGIVDQHDKQPNGVKAARLMSQNGKTTVLVDPRGDRTLFHDGKKIVRENSLKPSAEIPEKPSFQDQLDALKASNVGLDTKTYGKLQDLIQKRYAEDLAAAQKRADRDQRQRLTREWRNNSQEMLKEVTDRFRTRPDIAADLFLGSGELFGKKLDKKYRLATDDLTEEQKAALPTNYIAKSGLPVDQVAKMFGFTSGDAMVAKLVEYNRAKAGATPQEMFGKLVRDETSRRMEAKYGDLQSNIMDEAKDQALSETNLNLLAEEMYAAASMAKTTAIDKTTAVAWAKDQFDRMKLTNVNADKFMETMAKHGRDAERALIAGDPASALVSMQKKYLSALLAAQARGLQKELKGFEAIAKRFRPEKVANIDPEYTNYIQQILGQVGRPSRRLPENIFKDIQARDTKDLATFVGEKAGMLREIPILPDLLDSSWRKDFSDLTTAEFRGVNGSLKALVHNGRDELKIEKAGEAADLADVKGQMIELVSRFKERMYGADGRPIGQILPNKLSDFARSVTPMHLQMETIFNHWDNFDHKGPWYQYLLRGLIEGANQEDAWKKEYAGRLRGLADGENLKKLVPNDLFKDPGGGPPLSLTRENLRAVMLNTGTKSNLVKMAKGYGLEPSAVMNWIHTVATKADWDFTQGVWDIFKDIKSRSDTMYRSLTGGVPADDIPATSVDTPFGKYDGGYYPVIWHPGFEQSSKKLLGRDPLTQDNYHSAMTPAGYTQSRTGYVGPMSLELDAMPGRISQMLHDIALRPAVINASKIFRDKDIQQAIRKHYGAEYKDMLMPYLSDIANSSNIIDKAQATWKVVSEDIRQNMVSTLVGLNPGTVLKHGPTALIQSIHEVGAKNFISAARDLFNTNEETGESNYRFAMNASQELQRRDRNWQEALSGTTQQITGKAQTLRQNIMQLASKPVAFSDILSAVPTWHAAYRQEIDAGASFGDAVDTADRAVRRAHGSTAITSRPGVMRNGNPWLTSVYGFFNHIMNRQAEMVWKAGEMMDLVKDKEFAEASKQIMPLSGQLFAYVLWPAIVEELVSPNTNDEHESWGVKAGKSLAHSLSGSWIGVRDLVNGVLMKKDPAVGLASTAFQEVSSVARDFFKDSPFSKDHAGRLIQDAAGLAGMLTGTVPQQLGRSARFVNDVNANRQHPQGPWGWLTGLRYGTLDKHSKTWDDWVAGK